MTDDAKPEPLLLHVTEAARLLGCSRSKAYELVATESIPTVRLGRSVRVPRRALEAWIEANTRGTTEPPAAA